MPSLEVKTAGISRVASLDGAPEKDEPSKDMQNNTPSPASNHSSNSTSFPYSAKPRADGVLERIAAQLQANQLLKSQTLEIKSEAVYTTGTALTTTTTSRSSSSPLTCTLTSSPTPAVTTQTLGKVNLNKSIKGTGTGSVTATPTSFTTAVTTTASTTSTTSVGQDILGKRVRKQSTKYEDFEQPPLVVSLITLGFHPGGTQNLWGDIFFLLIQKKVKSKLNIKLAIRVLLIIGSVTPY